ncbi:prepilin-type cleavage/methylation domain-containing protein, partial [Aeromonas hydrophila]
RLANAGWAVVVKEQSIALYNLSSFGNSTIDINRYGWPVGSEEDYNKPVDTPYQPGSGNHISVSNQSDCRLLFTDLLDGSQGVASTDQPDAVQKRADYLSTMIGPGHPDEDE